MPYITFAEYPDAPGRSYRNAATDPNTGKIACEVEEVLGGEEEIAADEHARIVAAAEQWEIDNPPAGEQPAEVQPSLADQVAALSAIITELAPEKVAASTTLQAVKG